MPSTGPDEVVKASVCLITYNQRRTIAEAIDSVLMQRTSFPFELVIGDDGSTDGTRQIVRDYARRYPGVIRLLERAANSGGGPNFLDTFNACRAPLVAVLEGDDFWITPHKLELQVGAMAANPRATVCGTNAQVWNEREGKAGQAHPTYWGAFVADAGALLTSNFFSTCTLMVRKDGPLAIPPGLTRAWGDWALKVHFALQGDTVFLPELTGVHRLTGSGGASRSPVQREQDVLAVLEVFEAAVGSSFYPDLDKRIDQQIDALKRACLAAGDQDGAAAAARHLRERAVTIDLERPDKATGLMRPLPAGQRGATLGPTANPYAITQVVALLAAGQATTALGVVDEALTVGQSEPALVEARALALAALGRYPEAVVAGRQWLAVDPQPRQAFQTLLGIMVREAGLERRRDPLLFSLAARLADAAPDTADGHLQPAADFFAGALAHRCQLEASYAELGEVDARTAMLDKLVDRALHATPDATSTGLWP